MLHLPNDLAEFRKISAEHAIAPHPGQLGDNRIRGLQQLHEQAAIFWI